MIQRIQSVYFLLTSAASIIFLSGDFLSFFNESGSEVFLDYRGVWMQVSGGAPVLLGNQAVIPVICLLLAILPIAAIFLYKNRKLQFKAAVVSVVKKGRPVPPPKITTLFFEKCESALARIYGSATSGIVNEDITLASISL